MGGTDNGSVDGMAAYFRTCHFLIDWGACRRKGPSMLAHGLICCRRYCGNREKAKSSPIFTEGKAANGAA